MKALSRVLFFAVILGLFSLPTAVSAYDDDDQPHMKAALEHLRKAKEELEIAKHDKGGHRAAAGFTSPLPISEVLEQIRAALPVH